MYNITLSWIPKLCITSICPLRDLSMVSPWNHSMISVIGHNPPQQRAQSLCHPLIFRTSHYPSTKWFQTSRPNVVQIALSPSLIAKITEQVINSLQSVNYTAAASSDGQQLFSHCQSYPESPLSKYQSSSVSTDTSTSFRPVYTPPSRIGQACRMNEPSESKPSISNPGLSELDNNFSYGANGRSIPLAISETSHISQALPRQFSEVSNLEEDTSIGRTSQLLFDSESRPTQRLSQFLRGLANHIIRIEPKHYLVYVLLETITILAFS